MREKIDQCIISCYLQDVFKATNEALKAIDGYSYHHIKKYKKLIQQLEELEEGKNEDNNS